jgi:hypothetical protein
MARIRTVKPSFFRSLTITTLPIPARLTFVGLWTYVDDEGRGVDDPRLVKAELWPLDDEITTKKVESHLAAFAERGLILRYEFSGRRFLQVVGWKEHQRINRPQDSAFPGPFTEDAVNEHGASGDDARPEQGASTERAREEGNGMEQGTGTPLPPAGGTSRSPLPPNVEAHLATLAPLPCPPNPNPNPATTGAHQ